MHKENYLPCLSPTAPPRSILRARLRSLLEVSESPRFIAPAILPIPFPEEVRGLLFGMGRRVVIGDGCPHRLEHPNCLRRLAP